MVDGSTAATAAEVATSINNVHKRGENNKLAIHGDTNFHHIIICLVAHTHRTEGMWMTGKRGCVGGEWSLKIILIM